MSLKQKVFLGYCTTSLIVCIGLGIFVNVGAAILGIVLSVVTGIAYTTLLDIYHSLRD